MNTMGQMAISYKDSYKPKMKTEQTYLHLLEKMLAHSHCENVQLAFILFIHSLFFFSTFLDCQLVIQWLRIEILLHVYHTCDNRYSWDHVFKNIYYLHLAAPGVSCSIGSSLRCTDSLVVAQGFSYSTECGILVPPQGIASTPLHCKVGSFFPN